MFHHNNSGPNQDKFILNMFYIPDPHLNIFYVKDGILWHIPGQWPARLAEFVCFRFSEKTKTIRMESSWSSCLWPLHSVHTLRWAYTYTRHMCTYTCTHTLYTHMYKRKSTKPSFLILSYHALSSTNLPSVFVYLPVWDVLYEGSHIIFGLWSLASFT